MLEVLKEDIKNVWNPERFGVIRSRVSVGNLENIEDFNNYFRSVLDMPIKLPYSEIRLPNDLERSSIFEMIEKCVEFEKSINDTFDAYYMYLTVHHCKVEKGSSQRRLGAHIDGMQGDKYKEKLPVCHSYLVSNIIPTCFFNHEFPTNLCENSLNWFHEFNKVKDYTKSSLSSPYEINLMTAYNVHESTVTEEEGIRTFVRLEFSLKEFNRIGNTINDKFNLDWVYEEIGIPEHLKIDLFD